MKKYLKIVIIAVLCASLFPQVITAIAEDTVRANYNPTVQEMLGDFVILEDFSEEYKENNLPQKTENRDVNKSKIKKFDKLKAKNKSRVSLKSIETYSQMVDFNNKLILNPDLMTNKKIVDQYPSLNNFFNLAKKNTKPFDSAITSEISFGIRVNANVSVKDIQARKVCGYYG